MLGVVVIVLSFWLGRPEWSEDIIERSVDFRDRLTRVWGAGRVGLRRVRVRGFGRAQRWFRPFGHRRGLWHSCHRDRTRRSNARRLERTRVGRRSL